MCWTGVGCASLHVLQTCWPLLADIRVPPLHRAELVAPVCGDPTQRLRPTLSPASHGKPQGEAGAGVNANLVAIVGLVQRYRQVRLARDKLGHQRVPQAPIALSAGAAAACQWLCEGTAGHVLCHSRCT